jgi:hypothetical protein
MRLVRIIAVCSSVVVAGCSNGSHDSGMSGTSSARSASPNPAESLLQAARSALEKNHRVSVFVLWHNQLPADASRSTGGPALASLQSSAATRRARGIRVRLLGDERRVLSLRLDPSYTKATASVFDHQRVQPSGRDGRRLGRAVLLNERATYELRRIDRTSRFVVWRVVLKR